MEPAIEREPAVEREPTTEVEQVIERAPAVITVCSVSKTQHREGTNRERGVMAISPAFAPEAVTEMSAA